VAIYVDLHPAPQFDRSLVTYCVINFGRLKDGIAQAGKRVETGTHSVAGPWPVDIAFFVPFKCDMTIWSQVTFWGSAIGLLAVGFKWNGNFVSPLFDMYFNEANSHKALSSTQVIRGLGPGQYTGGIWPFTGGIMSDGSDRWRMHYTFYEL